MFSEQSRMRVSAEQQGLDERSAVREISLQQIVQGLWHLVHSPHSEHRWCDPIKTLNNKKIATKTTKALMPICHAFHLFLFHFFCRQHLNGNYIGRYFAATSFCLIWFQLPSQKLLFRSLSIVLFLLNIGNFFSVGCSLCSNFGFAKFWNSVIFCIPSIFLFWYFSYYAVFNY